MKRQWNITVDGISHKIEYSALFSRKLVVDGQSYKLKSSNLFLNVIDYAIDIGGARIQLVVIGNKADLAVNGTFLGNGQPYQPVSSMPAWIWVFVGLSIIGGYFLSGILGMLVGLLFSMLYVKNGIMKKTGMVIAMFVLCSVIQVGLMIAVGTMLKSIGYFDRYVNY